MHCLTVFLLVGLGLASAFTNDFDGGLSIDRFENLDHASIQASWISDQMRDALEKMVEGFEKAIEQGRTISESAFRKAEEIYHKLMDWGIDVGEKIKEALDRIGENFENRELNEADTLMLAGDWITDRMREALEKMVEGFEKAIEEGRTISERAFRKAEELYHKLMDWGIDVGEKIKEAFERISKDFENNRGSYSKNRIQARSWISDQMRDALEKMVEGFEKAIEQGRTISESAFRKAEEMYHKLMDWGIDVGEKIKEALDRIGKNFDNTEFDSPMQAVQRGPMIDKLKEAFERVVNRIKEAFDSGNGVRGDLMKKAEDIYEKLKNMKVEISEKIRSIFEDLRSKMGRNSVQRGPMIDKLKEAFERVVNRIKEAFDSGNGVRGDLMKKAEDIYEKLKNLKVEISDKIRSIFEDMRNKMGRNGPTSPDASISNLFDMFRRLKQLIKDKLDSETLKEKVKELFGKGSDIAEQIMEMLKTKGDKAKQKILDWIDRILPDKEERSISEDYDELREFFQDLQLDLKESFTKFGKWVKEQYGKGLEKTNNRSENLRRIAKAFINDTGEIGKDLAKETLGFFREYRLYLNGLYMDIADKVIMILKKKKVI